MSIKRYNGSAFVEVNSRRRFNGTSWTALTFAKRWNGTVWVNVWNHFQGESQSAGASGSGTIKKISSTVSSPTVHYSGAYTYHRTGNTLSVPVTFSAWISSASRLGLHIRLTVIARINGGDWQRAVIKGDSEVWQNSSDRHTAGITLNAAAQTTNLIEWYVTRAGSSYSGTAGSLGSAKRPKKHTFSL